MLSAPPAAAELFGSALPRIEAYAELLAGPGIERGLLGPSEAERLWERHLLNCGVVAELVPASARSLVDIGSGAGLPGVVLAVLLPGVSVTLLEPMQRRADFLRECIDSLRLGNAEVLRGRAEDVAGQVGASPVGAGPVGAGPVGADVVTARAVAPLEKLAGLAVGLVRPGGLVLAIKGASAPAEVARARGALRRLGAREVEVRKAGSGIVEPAATVVTFRAGSPR
jgi:16S rRNA (guanine527-N7)-methyltransferase